VSGVARLELLAHESLAVNPGTSVSVNGAPASARNHADLAFGGGFRDHPRGTQSVRRSQFLLEFFSISWFTPMNDSTASWWLRAGLAAD
jgi:hypothetical protein